VNNADPGALVFVDVTTRTIAGQIAIGVGPDSVHVTPDGQKVVIAIEDEEDADNNGVEQARPGSVQVVSIDYDNPSSSSVSTIALIPSIGNLPGDPQPEFVDITADGMTAIVSLQENNLIAVIDLETESVVRFIDAGTSSHRRADLATDGEVLFTDPDFTALLEPDSVCLLSDERHFITANEGDTPNENFGAGLFAGGRGFSVFNIDGERVFDSDDSAEFLSVRRGAYPDGRSEARGIEIEGCAAAVFSGTDYAFLLGERNASLFVLDVSTPSAPALKQMIGAPLRPEGIIALPERNLVVVGGEGDDDVGGGIWIYQGVSDPADAGNGTDVYEARSNGTPFSALGALAHDPETGLILATPDNAFVRNRIWSFWADHSLHRVELVSELLLKDANGVELSGYDPEGIAPNPEGGYIVASEGIAGNGATAACVGSLLSNRILFFDRLGRLDPAYGADGIVDLPCGDDENAIDWTTVRANGFEGLTVVDTTPSASGGLKVYVAIQRGLVGEGQATRIGEYDVDTGVWNFYFYTLDPNPGGTAGNTFLSELTHVHGDTFVVVERDQGWSGEAGNKTLRTFSLSTGVVNDIASPVEKVLRVDLLAHPFRFDQEKIEGIALGGGSLFVTNDNDGGEALNFFLRLDPSVLLGAIDAPPGEEEPPFVDGQDVLRINEVNSQGDDFIELVNTGSATVDLSGWKITDNDPTHVFVLPAGTVVGPGQLVLVSGEGGPEPALTFGLGSADAAILYTPFDVVVDEHTWVSHVASASRCADGVGAFVAPTTATPGAPNACPVP
jgi:DNA-binding beta-propeller fold protein YncE